MFSTMMRWAADKGWNQSDLASQLRLSPQVVSNWKRRGGVPPEQYATIAALFGRSVEQLLGIAPEGELRPTSWPYQSIDEMKFHSLKDSDAAKLEGAILYAAAQVGVDIKKDE